MVSISGVPGRYGVEEAVPTYDGTFDILSDANGIGKGRELENQREKGCNADVPQGRMLPEAENERDG